MNGTYSRKLCDLDYSLYSSDPPSGYSNVSITDSILDQLEAEVGLSLPADYRAYMLECGGAYIYGVFMPRSQTEIERISHIPGMSQEACWALNIFGVFRPLAADVPEVAFDLLWQLNNMRDNYLGGHLPIAEHVQGHTLCISCNEIDHGAIYSYYQEDIQLLEARNDSKLDYGPMRRRVASSYSEFFFGLRALREEAANAWLDEQVAIYEKYISTHS